MRVAEPIGLMAAERSALYYSSCCSTRSYPKDAADDGGEHPTSIMR
jgi:hypothetical protein